MSIVLTIKKQKYISFLEKLIKTKALVSDITKAYFTYKKFCYDNNLKDDLNFASLVGDTTILSFNDANTYIDDSIVANAISHFYESSFLYEDEIEMVLKWVVQNARTELYASGNYNFASYMHSCAYFAQALSALPFINSGIPITINDARIFNNDFSFHPFITVILPTKIDGVIILKQYLIDLTYRQFFSLAQANDGTFYENQPLLRDRVGPSAGYYVSKSLAGRSFAIDLVKNGYIELTAENAKIYGSGFECETLNKSNYGDLYKIMSRDGN